VLDVDNSHRPPPRRAAATSARPGHQVSR
jgi:hypothetical protein